MITAKNYAAECANSLRNRDFVSYNGEEKIKMTKLYNGIAEKIKIASHFLIPDGGIIFEDKTKEGDIYPVIKNYDKNRMPFEIITIEYTLKIDGASAVLFLLEEVEMSEGDFQIDCNIAYKYANRKQWDVSPSRHTFDCKSLSYSSVEIYKHDLYPHWKKETTDREVSEMHAILIALSHLIMALSCKNVSHEPIEKNLVAANARRKLFGKPPLWETRILTINASSQSGGSSSGSTGTHASPKQHLRRGHIRRLPSGNIWVNSCIVGDPSKGVIKKSYNVK